MSVITFDVESPQNYPISSKIYGIFLEDINFAVDGGLNANMVNNYSFDGVYFDKKHKRPIEDPFRYWEKTGIVTIAAEDALSVHSKYARIADQCTLINLGYNAGKEHKNEPAMSIEMGHSYTFSCYLRNIDFKGVCTVVLENQGTLTEEGKFSDFTETWRHFEINLQGIKTGYGKLKIQFIGVGRLDIDCVQFYHSHYWGKTDAKWQHGHFRKDLVQALVDLGPKFMRFPGGCIVEGNAVHNEYNWKETVGKIYERKSKYNLWAEKTEDGGYNQSNQIGFYEYFCLCEDLGAKPLPTLFAGLNCQARCITKIDHSNPAIDDYVVQNYLDLIEFANGDPESNRWAKLRAEMGHPKPFGLDMIGIGNENFGKTYHKLFARIQKAIHEKYPTITCVLCGAVAPVSLIRKGPRQMAKKYGEKVLCDEHCYHSPRWFIKAATYFDKLNHTGLKIYFGEYAANGLMAGHRQTEKQSNTYASALAEAVFLTGVERNGHTVVMTSYAPLFNLISSNQWYHNLIDFSPKAVCYTANYLVQKLFATNIGNKYIIPNGNVPKGLYLSATSDEKYLYLKLINHTKKPMALNMKFPGVGDQRMTMQTLFGQSPSSKNTIDFYGVEKVECIVESKDLEMRDGEMGVTLKTESINIIGLICER